MNLADLGISRVNTAVVTDRWPCADRFRHPASAPVAPTLPAPAGPPGLGSDANLERAAERVGDPASMTPPGACAPFLMAEMTAWRVPAPPGKFGLRQSGGSERVVDQFCQLQASLGLNSSRIVLGSLGITHGGKGLVPYLLPRGRGAPRFFPFFFSLFSSWRAASVIGRGKAAVPGRGSRTRAPAMLSVNSVTRAGEVLDELFSLSVRCRDRQRNLPRARISIDGPNPRLRSKTLRLGALAHRTDAP